MAGFKGKYSLAAAPCASPGAALLIGSFTCAGDATPVTSVSGKGFTVGNPATGVIAITLADGVCAGVYSGWCVLEDSTANANDTVRFGDLDAIATDGTFTIITASSAGTDASLNGPRVHFGVWVRNTSLT